MLNDISSPHGKQKTHRARKYGAIIQNKENRRMEKLLLKPKEAAEMTSTSKNTIYNLVASGELKSIRLGRAIRIPMKALEEWIEANQSIQD